MKKEKLKAGLKVIKDISQLKKELKLTKMSEKSKVFNRLELRDLDLSKCDLEGCTFQFCHFYGVNFSRGRLSEVTFNFCTIFNCSFKSATLIDVDFYKTHISICDFDHAAIKLTKFNSTISDSFFNYAELEGVNMRNAGLFNVEFIGADLSTAELEHANLVNCTLNESDKPRLGTVLSEPIIAYKKGYVYADKSYEERVIDNLKAFYGFNKSTLKADDSLERPAMKPVLITLSIPAGAVVFGINNNKFRTNMCRVVDIEAVEATDEFTPTNTLAGLYTTTIMKYRETGKKINEAFSIHNNDFKYRKGDTIVIKDFDTRYNVECGEGIHFFKTIEEALNY